VTPFAELSAANRRACIHSKDVRYVTVADMGGGVSAYRLNVRGMPCIEGDDGIFARFTRGATVRTLTIDHSTTARAIEAAIRTMLRFKNGTRS